MTEIFIANWSHGYAAEAINEDHDASTDELARPAFSHVFSEWTKKQEVIVKATVQEYFDDCPYVDDSAVSIKWTYHDDGEADVVHFLGEYFEDVIKITVIKLTVDADGIFNL